jgi:hypothetical protein
MPEKNTTLEGLVRSGLSPVSEYKAFLETFIETVKICDPRWKTHPVVRKAWENIKNKMFTQLKSYKPEPEIPIDHVEDLNSDLVIEVIDTQPSESTNNTILDSTLQPEIPIPKEYDATRMNETERAIIAEDEMLYNPDKA